MLAVLPKCHAQELTIARKRFHRKVRSGCRACKHRHVKCDEHQPICVRCSKAGFECEYDTIKPWIFEPRWKDARLQEEDSNPRLDKSLFRLHDKASDAEHFQFFCENTSAMFASYLTEMCLQVHSELDQIAAITWLGEDFWLRTLPSAALAIPVVKRAVIALGAAARVDFTTDSSGAHHDYIVNMNEAIMLLTTPAGQTEPLVILLSSMVFAACDCLQQEPRRGLLHLKSGLKILEELYPSMNAPDQTLARDLLQPLLKTYVKGLLAFEAGGLIDMTNKADLGIKETDELIPAKERLSSEGTQSPLVEPLSSSFNTIHEAVDALSRIDRWTSALQLLDDEILPDADSTENGLKAMLAQWTASLERGKGSYDVEHDPHAHRPLLVCYIHYQMMYIIIQTFPYRDETAYDSFGTHFRILINKAQAYVKLGHVERDSIPPCSRLSVITPLMFAALHCRIPRLRNHALKLLQNLDEEDDIWHSSAAYTVCQSIADSERFGAAALLGKSSLAKERRLSVNASDSVVRYPWDIPESVRLRVISIAVDQPSTLSELKSDINKTPSMTIKLKIAHAPFTGKGIETEERTVRVPHSLESTTTRIPSLTSTQTIQLARSPEDTNDYLTHLLANPQPQRFSPRKVAIAQRLLSAKEDLEILKPGIDTSADSTASSSPATIIKAEHKGLEEPLFNGEGNEIPMVQQEMCGLLKATFKIPSCA